MALTIGKNQDEVLKNFGEPDRIDLSAYGYDWWIYNKKQDTYFQLAMDKGKVISAYGLGDLTDVSPFYIGQPIDEIYSSLFFETSVDIDTDSGSYHFELSEEDMNIRPLIKIGDIYIQLYLDKFTGTVSSVRYLNAETLIKQRPYEITYRGELVSESEFSEEDWLKVENGSKRQIFDFTNIIRGRFGLDPLSWDEPTSEVAFLHSSDMYHAEYFSHTSPTAGELAERLKTGKVMYTIAGENIAAKYVDAIEAMEGWLNSKGHRDTMLNKEFTHLGVGVYQKYYTQNFIRK
ncbi:CAP domain-containing protein [Peribacillus loiseleuriae]|uniref:CAP domain-containing protein n=1 Tax=Peribacillus loiseleuriae TaxID=1679170 RepID=UPI0037F994B6